MDNNAIHDQISQLVAREQELRSQSGDEEAARTSQLRDIEQQLDQCWDLLRQRRALQEQGESAAAAEVRPVSEVEGYRQ